MSRFIFDQSERLNLILAEFENFNQPIGEVYRVYKFRKVGNGITRLTTQGEKDFNKYSTNKSSQFLNVYNGKAPIVVVWNNSTELYVSEDKKRIAKKYEIGDFYFMFGNNNYSMVMENSNLSLLGKDYVTQFISKTLTLWSNEWIPDNDDMVDYIYMVLDKRAQSYLWLELVSYEPTYNEETKKYEYGIFTFETINTKYITTGKTILDFIQFGAQGEGYAFPIEVENEKGEIEVLLDGGRLDANVKGTKYIQIDFLSAVALSSIFVYGRKKITDIHNIEAPKPLFLYKSIFPSVSPFFYNTPNANYYFSNGVKPTKTGVWNSYKEQTKRNEKIGEYNILNKKEVMCGFQIGASIEGTNPVSDGKYKYNIWDNEYIYNWDTLVSWLGIFWRMNPYFIANNKLFNKQYKTVADWLNVNNLFNSPYDVFNFQYEEITKWKLTDTMGIFGGIVNAFIGGLDIGWTTSKVKNTSLPMNLLIPCISYLDGISALDVSAPLPADIFVQEKDTHVIPVSSNIMCSFKFSLTDRFRDFTNVKPDQPEGRGGNGIWDTKYMGQTQYEDGSWINADHTPFVINAEGFSTLEPLDYETKDEQGFIIDALGYHAVGMTDTRITTYDVNGESSYEAYFETMSKARNDLRIWKNFVKFNCYENFNTTGKINWPIDVQPVKPTEEDYYIDEICNKNIFNYTPVSLKYDFEPNFSLYNEPTQEIILNVWRSKNEILSVFKEDVWDFSIPNSNVNYIDLTQYLIITRYLFTHNYQGMIYGWAVINSKLNFTNNNQNINFDAKWTKKSNIISERNKKIEFNNDKFLYDIDLYSSLDFIISNDTENMYSIPIPKNIGEVNSIEVDIKFDKNKYFFMKDNDKLIPFLNASIISEITPLSKVTFTLTRTDVNKISFSYNDTLELKQECTLEQEEEVIKTFVSPVYEYSLGEPEWIDGKVLDYPNSEGRCARKEYASWYVSPLKGPRIEFGVIENPLPPITIVNAYLKVNK